LSSSFARMSQRTLSINLSIPTDKFAIRLFIVFTSYRPVLAFLGYVSKHMSTYQLFFMAISCNSNVSNLKGLGGGGLGRNRPKFPVNNLERAGICPHIYFLSAEWRSLRILLLIYTALTAICSWTFQLILYTVGLLGRGISPSQGRHLHAEQHKHRINGDRHPCLEWDSNRRS
jgi:hypothetical protein